MQTERHWRYRAEDNQGGIVRGSLVAIDARRAIAHLKERGLAPIDIKEASDTSARIPRLQRSSSLSQNDLAQFCDRLADLLNSGVTVLRALALIANQPGRKPLKAFAERLHQKLRKGESLSSALLDDAAKPPRIMTALAASGEALGNLGDQFDRLATSFKSRAQLQRDIIGQLIYPAALLVLIIVTLVFLSFFVLPEFETVFLTASASPPVETRFVLAAGALIRTYWAPVALVLLSLIVALRFIYQAHRDRFETVALSIPVIGLLLRKIETARYCRSLGELLCGGMPLARAMPIARAAISNLQIRNNLANIEAEVRNGASLSNAASNTPTLTSETHSFIELGEETGDLGAMIIKAADYLEGQITTNLKHFAALSGPVLTAIMGLLTAGVIAAVMSGVMSLNDAVY